MQHDNGQEMWLVIRTVRTTREPVRKGNATRRHRLYGRRGPIYRYIIFLSDYRSNRSACKQLMHKLTCVGVERRGIGRSGSESNRTDAFATVDHTRDIPSINLCEKVKRVPHRRLGARNCYVSASAVLVIVNIVRIVKGRVE